MTGLYLGVDGGNSKTVALVADSSGTVCGRGRAGVGDIYAGAGAEEAVEHVVLAVRSALAAASGGLADVHQGAFRLAGVDWSEDEDYWQRAIAARLRGLRSWTVKNDGFAMLRCGDLSGSGVAITAGTGPAVAARGPSGAEFCASWWIQDQLGGQSLGNAAFAAVVAAELGLGPQTSLIPRLLRLYGLPDVESLLYAFTRRENPRPERDKWRAARSVLQASGECDPVATEIVRAQARSFAAYARVAADKVGLRCGQHGCTVVLGGSVLASEHSALRDATTEELLRAMPDATVSPSGGSPVAGALLDAMAEAGLAVSEGVRARVVQARHPEDFLLT